ncbi:MAG: potassium transporter TrkG, partial [Candidatus Nanopelagicales bacterium]
SAGFNSVDYSQMRPESWFITDGLMFIGGGSVSTSGGIRVTTLAVLFLVIVAKARGDGDVSAGRRRLGAALVEQALVVTVVLAVIAVIGTLGLMVLSEADLDAALFEVISALGTVGLSTGITDSLSGPAQTLLAVLMFIGRVGPLTLAAAVALRERDARYRYPEGRVLVG